jgi:hypothetical protein
MVIKSGLHGDMKRQAEMTCSLERAVTATASSVTGVGQGSADKAGQKGSEHLYVGVEKLIGTRVVASGYVRIGAAGSSTSSPDTSAGGTSAAVVMLPTNLPGNWNATFDETNDGSAPSSTVPPAVMDYAIFLTPYSSSVTLVPSVTAIGTVPSGGVVNSVTTSDTVGTQYFQIKADASSWIFWQVVRLNTASVTGYPPALSY